MPPNQNPYDFIMEPSKPGRTSSTLFQDAGKRKLVIAVFISVVLLVVVILFAVFQSLSGPKNGDAVEVVAYQTEVIRVIDLSLKETKDPTLRAELSTLKLFVTTDKKSVESYLSKAGVKISEVQLASKRDSSADKEITEAGKRNQAEATIREVMDLMTTKYDLLLNTSLRNSSSESKKKALTQASENLSLFAGDPEETR